jgi:hypothetical protein
VGRRRTSLLALTLLLASGCLSDDAFAGTRRAEAPPQPPGNLGAYQEPAPAAPKEKHAATFVNALLKQRGARKRVSVQELRGGVVLATRPNKPHQTGSAPPAARRRSHAPPPSLGGTGSGVESLGRLPQADLGPAQRAGVASPIDQEVPGALVGLIVAALFAAIGITLEVTGRRRKQS